MPDLPLTPAARVLAAIDQERSAWGDVLVELRKITGNDAAALDAVIAIREWGGRLVDLCASRIG